MGGFNSLSLALHSPGVFKKVASLCPVLYSDSLFSGISSIKKVLERTGADPRTLLGIRALGMTYVANEEEWWKTSPLSVLQRINARALPQIYLSCGLYDKYGNYEGVEMFAKQALAKGAKLIWRPLYGGHCVVDFISLSDFLLN
jgi:S-formylglutathione hydrolase FrmB